MTNRPPSRYYEFGLATRDQPDDVERPPPAAPAHFLGHDPAVRVFTFFCLAALVVILIVLMQRGFGRWSFFPVVVGALAVVFRWRTGALVFLTGLAGFVLLQQLGPYNRVWSIAPRKLSLLFDFVLAAATLAYTAAHYRLLGLLIAVLPAGPRYGDGAEDKASLRRPSDAVSPRETALFIVTLPVAAGATLLLWTRLPDEYVFDLSPQAGRFLVVTWGVVLALLLGAGFFGYVALRQMSRAEALLYLQDTLWRQTRREQRRVQQWYAWARNRRRKEKP